MREKILAHRIRWLIGLCIFLVLFGCSGFPIYNFTTGRQLGSWIVHCGIWRRENSSNRWLI